MYEKLLAHFSDKSQTINPGNWDNIYVVGDVHGCYEEFLDLIKHINLKDTELLVCVGDVIRKGPDSAGTVDIVRSNTNILSVLGNGEAKYLRGETDVTGLNNSHRSFIDTWPLVITWPGNAVVHGGFNPDHRVEDHSVKDILNMRSPKNNNNYDTPFWFDEFDRSTRVFFGHTVTNEPILLDSAVALDTGCVYGGKLTAFDTNNEQFFSVDAGKTYVPRDDSKYADTQRRQNASASRKPTTGAQA